MPNLHWNVQRSATEVPLDVYTECLMLLRDSRNALILGDEVGQNKHDLVSF